MGHAQRELERAQRHEGLRYHLTVGEEIRLAARQHWIVLVRPAAIALAITVASTVIFIKASPRMGSTLPMLLFGAALLAWLALGWRALERHFDLFVATDKRILKYRHLLVTDVPMMRMSKVTDLRYTRSVWGEILGYGTIIIESAGQDQAIRDLTFLPDPVENYRRLCEVIFGDKHQNQPRKRKAWRRRLDRLPWPRRPDPDPDDSFDVEDEERIDEIGREWSTWATSARPGSAVLDERPYVPRHRAVPEAEVLFESEDIKARRRAAKTGPIPYYESSPTDDPR